MQKLLFVPKYGYQQIASHDHVNEMIVAPHGLRFSPRPMREHIDASLRTLSNAVVPVISSEILTGHPFYGGLESDVYAERLKTVAPNARILLSIRAQNKALVSIYMQYLLRGGTMTPKQFFEGETDIAYYAFRPEHFEYDLLVAHYQNLFGPDAVHVTTQESLKTDMSAAAAEIAIFSDNTQFSGLEERDQRVHAKSYPEYAVPVLRRINHVQSSTLNPNPIIALGQTPNGLYRAAGYVLKRPVIERILGRYQPVSDYVETRFRGHFTQSNRRLSELMRGRVDLSAYA
jgi:hypothetical protein